MRTLFWHVDKMIVDVKDKAISSAVEPHNKHFEMGEGVVVFITLEKGDDNKEELMDALFSDIYHYINNVGANKILLYPYAHLSSDLLKLGSSMPLFEKIVHYLQDRLKEKGIEVFYSPFGWYKSFEVKVKGHPLSELSKHY